MDEVFSFELPVTYPEAVERVTDALKAEGFGVLTRIDLHEAFAEKLGESFRNYTILGACNPPLAFKAVSTSAEVGLFLPCNVTVEEAGPERSQVRILDPDLIMGQAAFGEMPAVQEVAVEAKARLLRVSAALNAG
jgi:uncharacterized protein (DUF302 family)